MPGSFQCDDVPLKPQRNSPECLGLFSLENAREEKVAVTDMARAPGGMGDG